MGFINRFYALALARAVCDFVFQAQALDTATRRVLLLSKCSRERTWSGPDKSVVGAGPSCSYCFFPSMLCLRYGHMGSLSLSLSLRLPLFHPKQDIRLLQLSFTRL